MKNKIQNWLQNSGEVYFTLYSTFFAFAVYFCMYAYRKPFTAGKFSGTVEVPLLGSVDYKILLIIAQVLGYTFSKFYGVKFISETSYATRGRKIIEFILMAHVTLLLFAITPAPYNIFFMFLNGIPLGMIWGLVFGFLEGRKTTEFMGAGLSASFIVSSGVVKTVGKILLNNNISEIWMPFVAGLLFIPVFFISIYFLNLLPPPSRADEALKTKRLPMTKQERHSFFMKYVVGLVPLIFLYMVLTAYRDFRDNFAREIWDALGYSGNPEIFSLSELPIGFGVLIILGALVFVKDVKKIFNLMFTIMISGAVLILGTTLLYQATIISPLVWMISIGLGLYFIYVPFGCILFDNLMALLGFVGTAGFMIYVSDAFGYLGSIFLMFYKNFGQAKLPWLEFFIGFSYITGVICLTLLTFAYFYFRKNMKTGTTLA